jgi:hypothetical protein
MVMQVIKRRLMALPIYAADYQEAEMVLIPQRILDEPLEAAVSACYQQRRSLLLLTRERIVVIDAASDPPTVLDIPLGDIEQAEALSWYGAGFVCVTARKKKYSFSLMSIAVHAPLAQRIEALAGCKGNKR